MSDCLLFVYELDLVVRIFQTLNSSNILLFSLMIRFIVLLSALIHRLFVLLHRFIKLLLRNELLEVHQLVDRAHFHIRRKTEIRVIITLLLLEPLLLLLSGVYLLLLMGVVNDVLLNYLDLAVASILVRH